MRKQVLFAALVAAVIGCKTEPKQEAKEPNLGFDLSSLDTTVDPCTDFFEYVSGEWARQHPVPGTESRWGNFNILIEENFIKLRGLLDSVAQTSPEKGNYTQLVGDFYSSAMDSTAIEQAGLNPLQDYFKLIDGLNSKQDIPQVLSALYKMNVGTLYYAYVGVDDKNSDAYIMNFGQSGLGLPDRDYYFKEDSVGKQQIEDYKNLIGKALSYAEIPEAGNETSVEAIYNFEKKLAEVSMSRVERRDPENTYNKLGYDEVVALAPAFGVKGYLEAHNVAFDSAIVAQPDFFKAASKIVMEEDLSTIKNYLKWNVVNSFSSKLPHKFEELFFDFYSRKLKGSKEMKPRWRRAIAWTGGGLGEPMGRLFADAYFPPSAKAKVEQMVEDLRSAYRDRINQLEWMSADTKEKAMEKLDAFTFKIGYPDKWESYEGLEITPDNFFANSLAIAAFGKQDNLDKLNEDVDRDEWYMPAYQVNAYYNPSYNEIVFPAGILQPPFYNPEADDAINYGGIGGVIGHEFTHGFDDQGSKYDAVGNLSNWWTDEDRTMFAERTNKIVAQYSGYEPLPEVFVNGSLTQGENIADLGGLTLAYYAYKKSHVDNANEQPVDIEGFTWQQRIFLGWGQVWQTSQTEQYLRQQVVVDPHSPARYRVNGPMSNLQEFWDAWGCTPPAGMINADSSRVVIW